MGASGGQVATTDGNLTVTVPAGALPADTTITITEIAAPAAGAVGKAYDIGPSGTVFATPVTLAFKYGTEDLQGNAPTDLEVATIENGAWVALAGDTVDSVAQIATGQTMHLSPYCIHSKKKGSGGGTDGGGDDGATPADGGDDGPVDSGPDAAGCKPGALQAGSCANHPVQICTAGYVFTNCVDQMPQGIRYSCCPAGA